MPEVEQQETERQTEGLRLPVLLGLLLACLAVRLVFIFLVPIGEAPDEGAHYFVIHFIRTHLSLPSHSLLLTEPADSYYGSLPPLGYLPQLLASFLAPVKLTVLTARLGSAVTGLVTVFAALKLGQIIFAGQPLLAFALPLLVIFHPQLAFVQSYSNNDSTTTALASLLIYLTAAVLKRGLTFRRCTAIGCCIGWMLLSKYSGYCILPVVALFLFLAARLHRTPKKQVLACLSLTFALSFFISAWWFVRNYLEFQGDLLGLKTMLQLHRSAYNEPAQLYFWPVVNNKQWRVTTFCSFWGMFGNMDRPLPKWIYAGFNIFLIGAAAGWLAFTAQFWLHKRKTDKITLAIWCMLAACALGSFAGMIMASVSVNSTGSPQGRYLFPSVIPILALLLGGLAKLPSGLKQTAVVSLLAFTVLACLWAWIMLAPIYGFSTTPMR